MIRPQQYRIGWPLSADQVEHIDTMFETLFRAVRRLSGGTVASSSTDEPLAAQALGLAGLALSRRGEDAARPAPRLIPGPMGTPGVPGLMGPPGRNGSDGSFGWYGRNTPSTAGLSDLVEGQTYTPALSFGGGTTGITYSYQLGRYLTIGKHVWFEISVLLTSKGSSTGANAITLPVATKNVANVSVTATVWGNTFGAGVNSLEALAAPNTSAIVLSSFAAGARTVLLDTDFQNTTNLHLSGHYEID